MSLPPNLAIIRKYLEARKERTKDQTALLNELSELDRRLPTEVLSEVRKNTTTMTSPADNVCPTCGRPN